jgi:hypothetical protein
MAGLAQNHHYLYLVIAAIKLLDAAYRLEKDVDVG